MILFDKFLFVKALSCPGIVDGSEVLNIDNWTRVWLSWGHFTSIHRSLLALVVRNITLSPGNDIYNFTALFDKIKNCILWQSWRRLFISFFLFEDVLIWMRTGPFLCVSFRILNCLIRAPFGTVMSYQLRKKPQVNILLFLLAFHDETYTIFSQPKSDKNTIYY